MVLEDFRLATVRAYHQPGGLHRVFQTKLAVFAYGLRDYMPQKFLRLLEDEVAGFHDDLSTVLCFKHFPRFSEESLAISIVNCCLEVRAKTNHAVRVDYRCSCTTPIFRRKSLGYPKHYGESRKSVEMVLDPFSAGKISGASIA